MPIFVFRLPGEMSLVGTSLQIHLSAITLFLPALASWVAVYILTESWDWKDLWDLKVAQGGLRGFKSMTDLAVLVCESVSDWNI